MTDFRRRAALVAVALVMAACGSTVQEKGAGFVSGGPADGLSMPEGDPGEGPAAVAGEGADGLGEVIGGGADPAASGATTAGRPGPDASASPGSGGAATTAPRRGPIELGVLYAVNDGAESAGVDNANSFSLRRTVRAFVAAYNAAGGIGGRRIQPVYAELHSASSNYEVQMQAACAAFTQDHDVAAVVSNLGYYSPTLLSCLQAASVPLVSGDLVGPDHHDAERFPSFITPTTLLGDVRVRAVVQHLAAAGLLRAGNRIGVVVEDCPVNARIYDNAVVPALRRGGLTLAATYRLRCFQSLQDYGGQSSDIQGAVLQFNSGDIDRVLFVSQGAEANIMNLFSTGAEAQGYRPSYALSSIALPAALALNAPAAQLANAKGVGWLPTSDSQDPAQHPPTSTGQRCLDMMREAGMVPTSAADYAYVYGPCDSFGLYDALLRTTGGDASTAAVLRALPGAGPRYVAASTLGGQLAMRDGRVGAGAARLFGWVDGRFEYTGDPFAV